MMRDMYSSSIFLCRYHLNIDCSVSKDVLCLSLVNLPIESWRLQTACQTIQGKTEKTDDVGPKDMYNRNPRLHDDAISFRSVASQIVVSFACFKQNSGLETYDANFFQMSMNPTRCCRHRHTESHQKHWDSKMDARGPRRLLCVSKDQALDRETWIERLLSLRH